MQNSKNPVSKHIRETKFLEHRNQKIQVQRIECLFYIHFQSHITAKMPFIKHIYDLRSKNNTFKNILISNKSSLLRRNDAHSNNSESVCQNLRNNFKLKIRKSYWSELPQS